MDKNNEGLQNLAILIAVANLMAFGLLFAVMHYFEFIGADTEYFDAGTAQNIGYIQTIASSIGLDGLLAQFGLGLDPTASTKVTTLGYTIAYGLALVVSGVSIMVAKRISEGFSNKEYELTEAV